MKFGCSVMGHMALQICLTFPKHNPLKQILSMSLTKPSSLSQKPNPQNKHASILSLTKRDLHFSFLALIFNGFSPPILAQDLALQRYIDSKEGFTLLRPSSWTQVYDILIYPPLWYMYMCMYICVLWSLFKKFGFFY